MQHNIYLYRNGEAADFIRTDTPREIIPIRLKTQFTTASTWYRDGKWEVMPANIEQQILDRMSDPAKRVVNDDKYAYCEFIENMCQPQHPDCFDKWTSIQTDKYYIEDYTAEQMAQYLSYRRLKQRYKYNTDKNKRDSSKIDKDWYAAQITADDESLTLAVTITQFDRMNDDAIENLNPDDYMPMTNPYWESHKCVFDIKNGTLRYYSENNWPGYKCHNFCYEDEDDIKKMSFYELFDKQSENLKTMSQYMPFVIDIAYKELLPLAEKFTGLSMQRYLNNPPDVRQILMMYYMTLIPTEPLLAPVLYNVDMQKRKFRFKYDRRDSLVLKKFYRKAHINDYPFLRKCYNTRPEALLTYLRMKDSGFKDVNLYNRVLSSEDNWSKIDGGSLDYTVFFLRYAIGKRGQLPALNLILRKDGYYISDSMSMFHKYFKDVPKTLRNDILKDGFTKFNHDALSEISYKCQQKNHKFKYTAEQKSLQDNIDGYEFRLPKDSHQLCGIGAFLHNCVASYSEKVLNKECTIIYAAKDGKYQICIEVCGNEVKQELTNYNDRPTKEQYAVLDRWHEKHGLVNS